MSAEPDYQMIVWQWAKSKVLAMATVGTAVSRVRCNPKDSKQFSTSGPKHLRLWRLETTALKNVAVIKPAKKEQEAHFLDHVWMRHGRLLVLKDKEEAEVLLLMLEVQEIHRRQDLVDHKVILEVQEVHNQTHPLQVAAVEAEDQEVLVLPVQEMLEAVEVQVLI